MVSPASLLAGGLKGTMMPLRKTGWALRRTKLVCAKYEKLDACKKEKRREPTQDKQDKQDKQKKEGERKTRRLPQVA